MRLLLIRHGRAEVRAPSWLLSRAQVARVQVEYESSRLVPGTAPPAALVAEVAAASLIACSDLPRATESAAMLAPGRPATPCPHFRELHLPIPMRNWAIPRAPLPVWELLGHLQWGIDILRGRDVSPEGGAQAARAVAWCHDVAQRLPEHATVAVVTHGMFRRLLARSLEASGWRPERARRSYANWSVWRFTAPPRS